MRVLPIANNSAFVNFNSRRSKEQEAEHLKRLEQQKVLDNDIHMHYYKYVAAYNVSNLRNELKSLKTQQDNLLAQRLTLNQKIADMDSEIQRKVVELSEAEAKYMSFKPDLYDFAGDVKKGDIALRRREAEFETSRDDGFDWSSLDRLNESYNNAY